jgi:hypothetical protein
MQMRIGLDIQHRGIVLAKSLVIVAIFFWLNVAHAAWSISEGKKISPFPPLTGKIATLPAKGPFNGMTAKLYVECFTHPELTGLSFGILLSKSPPNGYMGWTYQYDDAVPVQRGPFSRALPVNFISLGDATSGELKGLLTAKRLHLILQPASGGALPFDFDVVGAAAAIAKIPCKEFRRQ